MLGKSIARASAALFALILIASCDQKQETKTAAAPALPPPVVTAPAAPTAPEPPAPTGPMSAAAAETPPPAPAATPPAAAPAGNVIATAEGNTPGTRIEVLELKRTSGDSVMLKLTFVNDSDKPLDMGRFKGDGYGDYRSVSGVYLLDGPSKRQYFVLKGADRKCVCSQNIDDVGTGARVNVWARFTAPPADVQKVAIVVPHFIPLEDVPIAP